MARPKAFEKDEALDAAISVFREHGFEGTSTDKLTAAMNIGRQSLYDTFGDKWQLYCAALRRYAQAEAEAHIAALRKGKRAFEGITAMVDRVSASASVPCLGVNSVCEFGRSRQELVEINETTGRLIQVALAARIREAQDDGDIAPGLEPAEIAAFLISNFAGLRIAARGGATPAQLRAIGHLALRALA